MIISPTPCYFTATASGEAAQAVMYEISPKAAVDIEEVTLLSMDFESDIAALNTLDGTIKHVSEVVGGPLEVTEHFNPLFVPSKMEDIDSLVDLNINTDGMRFTGFGGDPFTLKQVDLISEDEPLATFSARYHPFDLPSYSDITASHDRFKPS